MTTKLKAKSKWGGKRKGAGRKHSLITCTQKTYRLPNDAFEELDAIIKKAISTKKVELISKRLKVLFPKKLPKSYK